MELKVTNVNQAFSEALMSFAMGNYTREQSRNGPVLVYNEPVTTIYTEPCERVLFSPERDANPFFHLMEALWMLAGRNDVQWITQFNSTFGQYSDDGKVFNGAYGHRWINHFGHNQLIAIAEELKRNPASRRCVLAMWDAHSGVVPYHEFPQYEGDLLYATKPLGAGKDAPCNTHVYFDCRHGELNMTVCCRSNDLWLGAYGANAVHMSVLHEVMAAWVGVPMGVYRQFSNNLHLYTNLYKNFQISDNEEDAREALKSWSFDVATHDHYENAHVKPLPLIDTTKPDPVRWWFADLEQFMRNPLVTDRFQYRSQWFIDVAVPMYAAWMVRKQGKGTGLEQVRCIRAFDWQRACRDWIVRAEERKLAKRSAATANS